MRKETLFTTTEWREWEGNLNNNTRKLEFNKESVHGYLYHECMLRINQNTTSYEYKNDWPTSIFLTLSVYGVFTKLRHNNYDSNGIMELHTIRIYEFNNSCFVKQFIIKRRPFNVYCSKSYLFSLIHWRSVACVA